MHRDLILASSSPRRQELMKRLGVPFEVISSSFEEQILSEELPKAAALRLAYGKAADVAQVARGIIVGADTLIAFQGEIFGKPTSKKHACAMLRRFSRNAHAVITGVAIIDTENNKMETFVDQTEVFFRSLSNEEIAAYVETGEPLDKAGAYAIQGGARGFVERIEGDFDTIVGLPVEKVRQVLKKTFGMRL